MLGIMSKLGTKVRSIYILVLTTLAIIMAAPVMVHNKDQKNRATRTIVDSVGGIVLAMAFLQFIVALLRFIPPTMMVADKIPIA